MGGVGGGGEEAELGLVARLASMTLSATDLEQLARPVLELVEQLTGFESTYVTVVHWDDFKQEIRFSRNTGAIEVPEGALVEWSDTLCRRALLEGRVATSDVPAVWPDSDTARAVGIVTYVSVPIVTTEGSTFGTLCAASSRSVPLTEDARRVMELLARLLADQVERERHQAQERERVATAALLAHANAVSVASSEHKLKTPLAVIRSATGQLMGDAPLTDDERRALLDALDRQSAALEACVHDLLRHSGPASPTPELALTVVALEPVLLQSVADMRLVAPGREITLRCEDRLSCVANAAALSHIMGHLLDNAIKYTPGGSAIEVTAVDANDVVVVTVSDDGPGVTAEDLFRAFERGASSDGVTGSGLGLYIVRALAGAMEGTIEARRSPSGGARMQLALPTGQGVPVAP